MKRLIYICILFLFALGFSSCLKQTFLPDPNNPGLSMLTSKQFNTGTCYINDIPYINFWPKGGISLGLNGLPYPLLSRVTAPNEPDSVAFSWSLRINNNGNFEDGKYTNIAIKLPIPTGVSTNNLLTWSGKRITGNGCVLFLDYNNSNLQGTANIYFIEISRHSSDSSFYDLTGLFDGNIGDSIRIEKGRFDFIAKAQGF